MSAILVHRKYFHSPCDFTRPGIIVVDAVECQRFHLGENLNNNLNATEIAEHFEKRERWIEKW